MQRSYDRHRKYLDRKDDEWTNCIMCGRQLDFVNFSVVFEEICIDCWCTIPDCVQTDQVERFARTIEQRRKDAKIL